MPGRPHRRTLGLYALVYIYRRRLRVHAVAELLAGAGIAVAVALVLATIAAEGSVAGSTRQIVQAVVGQASLQLRARGSDGFDEAMLQRVEAIAGVKQAAALLEQTATVRAAGGRSVTVDLAGTDVSLAVLDGLAHTLPLDALAPGGIGLSRASARALGVSSAGPRSQVVTLDVRGRSSPLRVSAILGPEVAGAVSGAFVAVMPLARLQRLAGLPGRITRILVQPQPGEETAVRSRLQALAGGRLTVAPALQDVALLNQALRPSNLASQVFATIGALLGFLLAFNAMLLTVPERRQAIADLRLVGAKRSAIAQIVLFQALCLALAATAVGLAVGYALSVWVFHEPTGYLAEGFTLSSATVVGSGPLLFAGLGGIVASVWASAVPLLDLRRGRARDAVFHEVGVPGNALSPTAQRALLATALGVLAAASAVFALDPAAAIVAGALLALATVLAVPLAFALVLGGARRIMARRQQLTSLPLAVASLQATTLRSLALAATGAVALFGSVALGGSRGDLLAGIHSFASSYVDDAEIWVSTPGDNQAVNQFVPGGRAAAIAAVPAVQSVREFHGGFLALGGRQVWVIARPPGASRHILTSQILAGSPSQAGARLDAGGWIAVSRQIALEHHTGVGGTLVLPTPTGEHPFRIAATTTNLAWPPGVIFMAGADFSRYWDAPAPSTLGVELRPGASPPAARRAIAAALGPASGLEVALAPVRAARIDTLAGEGLGQLGEISTFLLIAAVAAMAAALASSVWQRRPTLAGLRLLGVKPGRLRRILLLEAALMLGAGCLAGAIAGIYGQLMLDGYLQRVTGFPLARMASSARPFEILALVLALALAIAAAPGWRASRVSPALALEDT